MGLEHRSHFLRAADTSPGEALCFDWSEIELATASYLRFAYVPVFRFAAPTPVITTGINKAVEDDLQLALEVERWPILVVRGTNLKRRLEPLGPLDDAYLQTLKALGQYKSVSSSALFAEVGHKLQAGTIGKTAWINRLNRLFEMGLITRIKIGKEYQYELIQI